MKNFLYNIQGHFINVNSDDLFHVDVMSSKHPRATIATDLVIENVENPDVPIFLFSFPEHIEQGESTSPNSSERLSSDNGMKTTTT